MKKRLPSATRSGAKRKGYHFSAEKALDVYAESCGHFTTLPKNDNTKLLITTAAQQLLAGKMTLAALRAEMTRLAKQLPEYDTVRVMYGVGETTAAQLMAEIGDVRRFPRRSSIAGFAGVDPAVNQSGSTVPRASLRPNAALRICGKRCTKSSVLT